MLDIFLSCNPLQFQTKLMVQTCENGEKANLGLNFGPLNFFRNLYLF